MNKLLFIFLVMVVGMPLLAGATPVLIESQPVYNGETSLLFPTQFIAQTFTVHAGGILSYVDVMLYRGRGTVTDLMLSVVSFQKEQPLPLDFPPGDVNILVPSDSVPVVPHYQRFDLTPFAFSVNPGHIYAFVVYGDPADGPFNIGQEYGVFFASGPTDYYTGGQYFEKGNGVDTWHDLQSSLGFTDVTFAVGIAHNPVPELSTMVLLGSGLIGLLGLRRKFKNKSI